jgi:hypothetical protein
MPYEGVNENFSIENLFRYILDLVCSQRIPETEFVNVSQYKRMSKDTTFS